uniref:Rx N-terminal domain-containing protein n=1 Tax=Oryza glumipatula TaxID=40148 RepID=A0A0D9YS92_9ORYZ
MTALVLTELHRMRDKKKASDTLAEDVAFIKKSISRLRKEIEHVNKTSGIYCNALNFGPDAAQPMVH